MSISVVIPAYNADRWIGRAIASVLHQTVVPTEIIVIDDGSADGTQSAVKGMGDKIVYVYQENSGVAAARNHGIEISNSEWIAFLDADDEWLPNWVKAHQDIVDRYPECRWSFCNFEYARAGIYWRGQDDSFSRFQGPLRYFEAAVRGMNVGTPGFLVHRSVFDQAGVFNPELRRGEDLDLWSRIAMRFPYIGYNSDICWRCWCDNANSLTRTGHSRDPQLKNICENALLAQSLGQVVINAYYPYARKRAMSYMLRAAARKVRVRREALDEAKAMFPLTFRERLLEAVLKGLPASISGTVVGRLAD